MRRRRLLYGMAAGAAAVGLSACDLSWLTERSTGDEALAITSLPVLGKAPEISSMTWINSKPLTLAGFQGKSAVGIAFWTYG